MSGDLNAMIKAWSRLHVLSLKKNYNPSYIPSMLLASGSSSREVEMCVEQACDSTHEYFNSNVLVLGLPIESVNWQRIAPPVTLSRCMPTKLIVLADGTR